MKLIAKRIKPKPKDSRSIYLKALYGWQVYIRSNTSLIGSGIIIDKNRVLTTTEILGNYRAEEIRICGGAVFKDYHKYYLYQCESIVSTSRNPSYFSEKLNYLYETDYTELITKHDIVIDPHYLENLTLPVLNPNEFIIRDIKYLMRIFSIEHLHDTQLILNAPDISSIKQYRTKNCSYSCSYMLIQSIVCSLRVVQYFNDKCFKNIKVPRKPLRKINSDLIYGTIALDLICKFGNDLVRSKKHTIYLTD